MTKRPVHIMASVSCVPCDFVQCISKSNLYLFRKICQYCGVLYGYEWISDWGRTQLRFMIMGTCHYGREMYTEPVYMCPACRTAKAHETAEGRAYRMGYPETDPFYILERENDHQPR